MTTNAERDFARRELFSPIRHDLNHITRMIELQGIEIAEDLGIVQHLTHKMEKRKMATEDLAAKVHELTGKLTDYEARVAASDAAKDTAIAQKDAAIEAANQTIAANQAVVDSLTAKIVDLQGQIAAGTDTTALVAEIQADIDSIPVAAVVPQN